MSHEPQYSWRCLCAWVSSYCLYFSALAFWHGMAVRDCPVPKPGIAASLVEVEEVNRILQVFWVVVAVVTMEEVVWR